MHVPPIVRNYNKAIWAKNYGSQLPIKTKGAKGKYVYHLHPERFRFTQTEIYSAVIGSITVEIFVMLFAGKPANFACSIINSSLGAI